MRRSHFLAIGMLCVAATAAQAHDLFFRMSSFFVPANASVRMDVLNGTFSVSENSVTRDRLRDLSVVTPAGRTRGDTTRWSATGDTSVFYLRTAEPGTYVVGASLLPREITLSAKDFNGYLETDGVPDILEARRRAGEMEKGATERYSKHIKYRWSVVKLFFSPNDDAFTVGNIGDPVSLGDGHAGRELHLYVINRFKDSLRGVSLSCSGNTNSSIKDSSNDALDLLCLNPRLDWISVFNHPDADNFSGLWVLPVFPMPHVSGVGCFVLPLIRLGQDCGGHIESG